MRLSPPANIDLSELMQCQLRCVSQAMGERDLADCPGNSAKQMHCFLQSHVSAQEALLHTESVLWPVFQRPS